MNQIVFECSESNVLAILFNAFKSLMTLPENYLTSHFSLLISSLRVFKILSIDLMFSTLMASSNYSMSKSGLSFGISS